jgi:hypothetical protein
MRLALYAFSPTGRRTFAGADVLDIFRQENIRRKQFWIDKFKLEADWVRTKRHVLLTDLPEMK